MPYVTVDVDLDEFSDEDLMEEIRERRIYSIKMGPSPINDADKYKIFVKYQDYFTSLELETILENNKPVITFPKEQLKLGI